MTLEAEVIVARYKVNALDRAYFCQQLFLWLVVGEPVFFSEDHRKRNLLDLIKLNKINFVTSKKTKVWWVFLESPRQVDLG